MILDDSDEKDNKKQKYNARPMTLYVNADGISEIDLAHLGVEAERIIDVQLSEIDAQKLFELLRRKLNVEVYGAVTFRLRGRLVL